MNLMRGIDLKKIAEKMNGASGAELKVCSVTSFLFFFSLKKRKKRVCIDKSQLSIMI